MMQNEHIFGVILFLIKYFPLDAGLPRTLYSPSDFLLGQRSMWNMIIRLFRANNKLTMIRFLEERSGKSERKKINSQPRSMVSSGDRKYLNEEVSPSGNDNWVNLESGFDRSPDMWARYTAGVLKYYARVLRQLSPTSCPKGVMDDYYRHQIATLFYLSPFWTEFRDAAKSIAYMRLLFDGWEFLSLLSNIYANDRWRSTINKIKRNNVYTYHIYSLKLYYIVLFINKTKLFLKYAIKL